MRDDLFELANDLRLKKFFLAGHSMGGKTAISFALKWPEMLDGLLIVDISPFTNESSGNKVYSQNSAILNAILSLDLKKISNRNEADMLLSEKIPMEKERGLILKNLQRTINNTFMWKLNASSLLKNLDNIFKGIKRPTDFSQQISGFPVVFLKGSDSDYVTDRDYKDIRNVFPAADIIEVTGAGHWIQVDKPDEVVKYLKNLLL
jgi:pimeloyl-ACP methyl ester carboxylesterase